MILRQGVRLNLGSFISKVLFCMYFYFYNVVGIDLFMFYISVNSFSQFLNLFIYPALIYELFMGKKYIIR